MRAKVGHVRTSEPFENLAAQCRLLGLPMPVAEWRFHALRRWKFDAAWPTLRLAVEFEGVTYLPGGQLGGRHTMKAGFLGDIEKYGEAFADGWSVLRVLPADTGTRGRAITWLEPRLRAGRR